MHLFQDHTYQHYEAPIVEDPGKFDYAKFEADGVNILSNGWREKFELLAQSKLAKLRESNPESQPFLVRRDHPFAYSGKPEVMKPLQFWFRLEKRG
jgi:hypothetical protein